MFLNGEPCMLKKRFILFFILILCLGIVFSVGFACNKEESEIEPQIEYGINEVEIEIKVDSTFQLKILSNIPYTAEVVWESENPSIATVDVNGVVTGENIGITRVVSRVDEKIFYTKVSVVENYEFIPEIVLDGEVLTNDIYTINILKNDYYTFSPILRNVDESVDFNITSSDNAVQVLESLRIKGISIKKNVELKISCEYQSKNYSILVIVNVIGE